MKPIAYLDWSVNVDCPKCNENVNLADNDDDSVVANAIFHNNWDALQGLEVTCACGHEFEIERVEY